MGDNTIRYNISQNDAEKNTDNTGGIMTWGSQPRGQIYNNTVFAGKGLKSNPAAFRGGDGFSVRNNIFVADHDGEIVVVSAGARSRTTATGGPTGICGWRVMPIWRPGGRRRARSGLTAATWAIRSIPSFAPGRRRQHRRCRPAGHAAPLRLAAVLASGGQGIGPCHGSSGSCRATVTSTVCPCRRG